MKRKLTVVGAAIGVPVLFGLAFALIGFDTAAAAMFVLALGVPFGVVCAGLIVGCVAIWRRCHVTGQVALIAGILLTIAIWLPQGTLTTTAVLFSLFTLLGCAVASVIGSRQHAELDPYLAAASGEGGDPDDGC